MNSPFNPDMAEISLRISKIQQQMKADGAEALLVSSNANLYYSATRFFRGYVWIPAEGDPLFFVIKPLGWDGCPLVRYIRKPEDIPAILVQEGKPASQLTGLELDTMTYSDIARLKKAFSLENPLNGSAWLRKARMTKTPLEIALMKEDGIHQVTAYRRFTGVYREDMTDLEFQIEMERILRLEGCLGFSRKAGPLMEINLGSVVCGDNADTPSPYEFTMGGSGVDPSLPCGADGKVMRKGTAVMVDMCGAFNGYQTDLTRVWSIGTLPELALRAHACSARILRRLETMALPGVPCSALYEEAMQIVREEKLEAYFMGHAQHAMFIGHGVGIELNEMPVLTPRSKDLLAENMTLAIEPKFVIPEVGAVGLENTYVVTPAGLLNITPMTEEITDLTR